MGLLILFTRKIPFWICKYCGENEQPKCPQCAREDGKLVEDELMGGAE